MRVPKTALVAVLLVLASSGGASAQVATPYDERIVEVESPMTTTLGLGTAAQAEGPVLRSLQEGEKASRIFRQLARFRVDKAQIRWISISRTNVGDEVRVKVLVPLATERTRQKVDLTLSLIASLGREVASKKFESLTIGSGHKSGAVRASRPKTVEAEFRLTKAVWDEMFQGTLSPSLKVILAIVESAGS